MAAMDLVLVRHGNTFAPGDAVVWVGARTDLPLVDKGRRQAEAVAAGLAAAELVPARIYAGPLKRTVETAAIVAAAIGLDASAVVISEALREIDYGRWEGRDNAAIRAEAADALAAWQDDAVWPEGQGWRPGEAAIAAAWAVLLATIRRDVPADGCAVVVSSNGIFRLVAKSLGLAPAVAKMATGAVARLRLDGDAVAVLGWNLDPAGLSTAAAG
jgi:probable phosphoglycerate mutase